METKQTTGQIKFAAIVKKYIDAFCTIYPDANQPRLKYEKGWVIYSGVKKRLDDFLMEAEIMIVSAEAKKKKDKEDGIVTQEFLLISLRQSDIITETWLNSNGLHSNTKEAIIGDVYNRYDTYDKAYKQMSAMIADKDYGMPEYGYEIKSVFVRKP